jgi:uncharacterized RDD family membrane protein YckC
MDRWAKATELLEAMAPAIAAPALAHESLTQASGRTAALDATKTLAGPWPRYWARSLDTLLFLFTLILVGAAVAPNLATSQETVLEAALVFFLLLLTIPLEAALYLLFDTTPGQWLCGIRVLDSRGGQVGFRRYFARSFKVFVSGLGAGIPIVNLITQISSYRTVARGGLASWDEALDTRVFRIRFGAWRAACAAALYLAIMATLAIMGAASKSPENALRLGARFASVGTPKMIDEETRLDSVEALAGLVLQYNLSLVDSDVKFSDQGALAEAFRGDIRNEIKATICSDEELKSLRDLGAKFRYVYRDKTGGPLGQVEIAAADCR